MLITNMLWRRRRKVGWQMTQLTPAMFHKGDSIDVFGRTSLHVGMFCELQGTLCP